MEPEPLLDSLRNAVNAMPDDVPLRLHLATMLLRAGLRDEAVRHLGAVLQREPGNAEAIRMLTSPAEVAEPPASPPTDVDSSPERVRGSASPATGPSPVQDGPADDAPASRSDDSTDAYDWTQAEDELRDVLPAMFVGEAGSVSAGLDEARAYDAEHTGLTLADVAGLDEVKKRLEGAVLPAHAQSRAPQALRQVTARRAAALRAARVREDVHRPRGGRGTWRAVHHRVVRGPDRHVRRPLGAEHPRALRGRQAQRPLRGVPRR